MVILLIETLEEENAETTERGIFGQLVTSAIP
jgi:hypothetical protein